MFNRFLIFRSPAGRAAAFLAASAVLAFLCLQSYRSGRERHLADMARLARLQANAGAPISISYGKVLDAGKDGTTIWFKTQHVEIRPPLAGVERGNVVSIIGTIAPDASITPVRVHIHRGQRFKVYVSIAALAVFMVLFFNAYRWDFRGWVFRERGGNA